MIGIIVWVIILFAMCWAASPELAYILAIIIGLVVIGLVIAAKIEDRKYNKDNE